MYDKSSLLENVFVLDCDSHINSVHAVLRAVTDYREVLGAAAQKLTTAAENAQLSSEKGRLYFYELHHPQHHSLTARAHEIYLESCIVTMNAVIDFKLARQILEKKREILRAAMAEVQNTFLTSTDAADNNLLACCLLIASEALEQQLDWKSLEDAVSAERPEKLQIKAFLDQFDTLFSCELKAFASQKPSLNQLRFFDLRKLPSRFARLHSGSVQLITILGSIRDEVKALEQLETKVRNWSGCRLNVDDSAKRFEPLVAYAVQRQALSLNTKRFREYLLGAAQILRLAAGETMQFLYRPQGVSSKVLGHELYLQSMLNNCLAAGREIAIGARLLQQCDEALANDKTAKKANSALLKAAKALFKL